MPEDPTHVAGVEFEKYVVSLFGRDFRILSWMQDESATREEIDFKPDLEVEHVASGTAFGVECKYRSSHFLGRLAWAKEYQLNKYDRYREKTGRRLFIVIGLGGRPDKPDYVYCIPAWQAAHTMLDTDALKRYRRDPRRKFRWDAGTRMLG
jgi:hypothetical protein